MEEMLQSQPRLFDTQNQSDKSSSSTRDADASYRSQLISKLLRKVTTRPDAKSLESTEAESRPHALGGKLNILIGNSGWDGRPHHRTTSSTPPTHSDSIETFENATNSEEDLLASNSTEPYEVEGFTLDYQSPDGERSNGHLDIFLAEDPTPGAPAVESLSGDDLISSSANYYSSLLGGHHNESTPRSVLHYALNFHTTDRGVGGTQKSAAGNFLSPLLSFEVASGQDAAAAASSDSSNETFLDYSDNLVGSSVGGAQSMLHQLLPTTIVPSSTNSSSSHISVTYLGLLGGSPPVPQWSGLSLVAGFESSDRYGDFQAGGVGGGGHLTVPGYPGHYAPVSPPTPTVSWFQETPYPSGYTNLGILALSIFITVIMVMVIIGNSMVCIAIFTEKSLKPVQNWFIASLAVSDFLLGAVIMPFSLARELMGYWVFGQLWCDIHAALDVLLCTASINNLCMISLDRYWSVTQAVDYIKKRTPRRARISIAFVWIFSACVSLPPLVGWKKQNISDSEHPKCELSDELGYVLYSAMGSFYIPAIVMIFVYTRIFIAARARAKRMAKNRAQKAAAMSQSGSTMGGKTGGTTKVTAPTASSGSGGTVEGAPLPTDRSPTNSEKPEKKSNGKDKSRRELVLGAPSTSSGGGPTNGDGAPASPTPQSAPPEIVIENSGGLGGTPPVHPPPDHCAVQLTLSAPGGGHGGETAVDGTKTEQSHENCDVPMRNNRHHSVSNGIEMEAESIDSIDRPEIPTEPAPPPPPLSTTATHHKSGHLNAFTKQLTAGKQKLGLLSVPGKPKKGFLGSGAGGAEGSPGRGGLYKASPYGSTYSIADYNYDDSEIDMDLDSNGGTPHEKKPKKGRFKFGKSSMKILQPAHRKMRQEALARQQPPSGSDFNSAETLDEAKASLSQGSGGQPGGDRSVVKFKELNSSQAETGFGGGAGGPNVVQSEPGSQTGQGSGGPPSSATVVQISSGAPRPQPSDAERHRRKALKARERRATLILGLIMASFVTAWMPFFIFYLLSAVCEGCTPPGRWFSVAFWMGYCNSAINPIIYTIFNRDFRRAFRKILCRK